MNDNIKTFKKNGFCIVRSAISPELRDFVTQYALFDEMQDFTGDDQQVPKSHSKYANPAMESLLLLLHPIMEENTGLKLYPTYSYYRIYRNGDSLNHHTDRNSCEISATLCFNYSYDDLKFEWPIYMAGYRAELKPGDMVIYKGCELDHWREELKHSDDVWHVQGFFHFVDAAGPNASWKFDKRETVGEKKSSSDRKEMAVQTTTKSYIQYTK